MLELNLTHRATSEPTIHATQDSDTQLHVNSQDERPLTVSPVCWCHKEIEGMSPRHVDRLRKMAIHPKMRFNRLQVQATRQKRMNFRSKTYNTFAFTYSRFVIPFVTKYLCISVDM